VAFHSFALSTALTLTSAVLATAQRCIGGRNQRRVLSDCTSKAALPTMIFEPKLDEVFDAA
jgi:hypothetical protein